MNLRRSFLCFTFSFLSLTSFHSVLAASTPIASTGVPSSSATTTNIIFPPTCFLSNSLVRASFLSTNTKVSAGSDVTLAGTIDNLNSYPISDLTLVARVVKLQKRAGSPYDTATDTVDRVVPLTGIYLNSKATASFSFTYHVPSDLPTGPYRVDLFLNGSDQFAIGGNEYLDAPLTTYPLAVTGKTTQTSFFDLSTLKVNGIAPTAQMLSTISVPTATTSVSVMNIYGVPRSASVTWSLYSGNFINPSALVTSKTDTLHLSPGTKNTVSFAYANFVHAKYLLVGKIQDGTKNSLFSLRIGRSDVVEPNARSLYLSSFPLLVGTASIAGCLTQNYSNIVATTTVNIALTAASGASLWSGSFQEGNFSSYPFQMHFVPASNLLQSMTLSVNTVDQSGKILSSSSVSYMCDPIRCAGLKASSSSDILTYVYVIVGILVVLLILLIALKKKKIPPQNSPNIGNI